MRLGIKGKQIAGVTAIVGLAVVVLSALNVARLARVVLSESDSRGQLLANAVFHRAREVVLSADDPSTALRADPGLRAILEASIYGESVTDAAIVDPAGLVIAASDPTREGSTQPRRADLGSLVDRDSFEQLRVIYSRDGQTLEVSQPMVLGDQAFASITIGVSTLLMRQELNASLRPALVTAAAALVVAVFVAALLAQLLLRPIHVIRSGLTRLGQGEFGVTLDLPPGDEFGELGSFFNSVSQQLSDDRTRLAGQKANLQSAVEHLEDAVALFSPSGDLLFTNPAMQPTLPLTGIGKGVATLLAIDHPYRRIVEETLAGQQSRGPVQVASLPQTGDGQGVVPADNSADAAHLLMTHAVTGKTGDLVGVMLVSRNVAYLSRMQSTLAYSQKLMALGRLTAGIAHEVKNPLNAMMIHLELLRTKISSGAMASVPASQAVAVGSGSLGLGAATPPPLPPLVKGALDHVQVIENEIRRLDEVVQGFLKFARPEDLRLQPVRIGLLLNDLVPVITPEANKHGVRILLECPPNLPPVNGDESMLRQVFLNLAINGCQAMPQGGTLRLVGAVTSGNRVEVKVEDTGTGIKPEHLGKIFDLYFTTKDHGTGIGLSMVYRIVQLHDGDVEVQSTPGRGTTFRVLLPRSNNS
ncbi:MAG: ATP-binding protein [Vicinamibacterales bacterium]